MGKDRFKGLTGGRSVNQLQATIQQGQTSVLGAEILLGPSGSSDQKS